MKVAPFSIDIRSALVSLSFKVGRQIVTSPPYPLTASIFTFGADDGITIYAVTPNLFAARERA